MAAVSKSAAHGVLVQPLVAGTARQAQAAAAGDPLNKQALGAAAAAAGGMEAAEGMAMYDSDEESVYDDIAQSSDNPQNDGSSGWAWLVDGVLQQVRCAACAGLSQHRLCCTRLGPMCSCALDQQHVHWISSMCSHPELSQVGCCIACLEHTFVLTAITCTAVCLC
jgi:hypothetical protein